MIDNLDHRHGAALVACIACSALFDASAFAQAQGWRCLRCTRRPAPSAGAGERVSNPPMPHRRNDGQ